MVVGHFDDGGYAARRSRTCGIGETLVAGAVTMNVGVDHARQDVLPSGEDGGSMLGNSLLVKDTHYAAIEYPREVNEQIRSFLKQLGYGTIP